MRKPKIEAKITIKTNKTKIAGMQKHKNDCGNCDNCYYYTKEKKKVGKSGNIEHVLADYCNYYHNDVASVKETCSGSWAYTSE